MPEQRQLKRRHLIYYLRVFDQETASLLGHLVDITSRGIMLVSDKEIPLDQDFRLLMDLPNRIQGQESLEFSARSLWTGRDVNPDFFVTGFQIQGLASSSAEAIRQLIEDFGFKD